MGNNSTAWQSVPVYLQDIDGNILDGFVEISRGNDYGLALKQDGSVWAWGYNGYGQLGNKATSNKSYAAPVLDQTGKTELTGVIDISTAMYSSYGITGYGELISWGYNGNGELADKGTSNKVLPNYPTTINNIVKIIPSSYSTVALKADGTVWSWGWNAYGQLANGTTTSSSAPVQMKADSSTYMTNVMDVGSTGGSFSVTTRDNKVYAVGGNYLGLLGDNTTSNRSYFTEVKAMYGKDMEDKIVRLSKSMARTDSSTDISVQYYIREDGSILGTGKNTSYQLFGQMTTALNSAKEMNPTYLEIERASYIKVGETKTFNPKLVENFNLYSKVPTDFDITWSSSNEDVATVDSKTGTVTAVSEGHTVIRGYDKKHGYITSGVIYVIRNSGNAITEPQVVNGGAIDYNTVTKGSFTTILKANGTVWASGTNDVGQLGNKTTSGVQGDLSQVVKEDGTALTNIVKIASGAGHTLALDNSGKVWAWGWNNNGQLGTNNKTNYQYAVPVLDEVGVKQISNIIDISAGYYHSSFVTASGEIYQVGLNNYGQLGDNTNTQRLLPVKMLEVQNMISVSSGMYFTTSLKADGTVWTVRI